MVFLRVTVLLSVFLLSSFVALSDSAVAQPSRSDINQAIDQGDSARVDEIMSASPGSISARVPGNEPPLCAAVNKGDLAIVMQLLHYGADPDTTCLFSEPVLVNAVLPQHSDRRHVSEHINIYNSALRNLPIARSLLEAGANPDMGVTRTSPDGISYRITPLMAAVDCAPCVELLLEYGADVTFTNALDQRPLHYAAAFGDAETAGAMLAAGASPNVRDRGGLTPLHYAAAVHPAFFQHALGFTLDGFDQFAHRGLSTKKAGGDSRSVPRLVAAGADVDATDLAGRTPLHMAASAGTPDVVMALLEAGAPVDASDANGETPLSSMFATLHGWSVDHFGDELAVRPRAAVHAWSEKNAAPVGLMIAGVMPGSPADSGGLRVDDVILRIEGKTIGGPDDLLSSIRDAAPGAAIEVTLVRAGERVTRSVHKPRQPGVLGIEVRRLREAERDRLARVYREQIDDALVERSLIYRLLANAGAKVTVAGRSRMTPLHHAAANPLVPSGVGRSLISAGANIEARNIKGETPLHLAATFGNTISASLLLGAGADLNALNAQGYTVLDLAKGSTEEWLARNGAVRSERAIKEEAERKRLAAARAREAQEEGSGSMAALLGAAAAVAGADAGMDADTAARFGVSMYDDVKSGGTQNLEDFKGSIAPPSSSADDPAGAAGQGDGSPTKFQQYEFSCKDAAGQMQSHSIEIPYKTQQCLGALKRMTKVTVCRWYDEFASVREECTARCGRMDCNEGQ